MADEDKNIFDLEDELQNLFGTEVVDEVHALGRSKTITDANFQILMAAEDELEKDGREFFNQQNPEKQMDQFQLEYLRRLHNYVVSVYSLINHSERIIDNYGDEEFREHYFDELRDRNLVERGEFIRQLRHYTQKRKHPPIGATMKRSEENPEPQFNVYIGKDDLLEWDGWSKDARKYLKTLSERVDLDEVIQDYQETIQGFYDWYFRFILRYHMNDVREHHIKKTEIQELLKDEHPGLVEYYRQDNSST